MNDERISILEISVTKHDSRLCNLEAKTEDMGSTLNTISQNLDQIKFIAIGMFIYFILQEFGLFAAFKVAAAIAV